MRIACIVEGEGWIRHSAAMLRSLLTEHDGRDVRVDFLHPDDRSDESRARVGEMVAALGGRIDFHRIGDDFNGRLPTGSRGRAIWYTLGLHELLPDAERVLYLDCDLLVVDSLLELWHTALDGNIVAAVRNVTPPDLREYTERPELGGNPYFNLGVMLLDLEALRREGLGDELRRFAEENAPRLRWRAQDAFNEVLGGRALLLPPRWNVMNAVLRLEWSREYFAPPQLEEAFRNPAIRHYEGPGMNKPWHLLGARPERAKYRAHRRHTPWPRVHLGGITAPNLVKYARWRWQERA